MIVERVDDHDTTPEGSQGTLVVVVRGGYVPIGTTFHTSDDEQQQVATIRRPAGGSIPAHVHRSQRREVHFTPEVFVVQTGRMAVDVYNSHRDFVKTVEVRGGDVVIIKHGGHGIRFLEDTIFVEVKQGPYYGREADKTDIAS